MVYNVRLITKYMLEYDTGVPLVIIIGVVMFVSSAVLVLYYTKINYRMFVRQSAFWMFMGYVFLVLCTTIFFREISDEIRYSLRPLGSYIDLYNGMLAQNIMNILLFVPIGFLAGGSLKRKNILNAIEIGIVLSLFIELVQLLSRRGVCNIDDVIHNTVGCAIGFGCFVFFYRLTRRIA